MELLAPRKYIDVDRLGELLIRKYFNTIDPTGLTSFERFQVYEMMKVRVRNLSDSATEYTRNIKLVVEYLEI